jgi:hypothetical protein
MAQQNHLTRAIGTFATSSTANVAASNVGANNAMVNGKLTTLNGSGSKVGNTAYTTSENSNLRQLVE